MLLLSAMGLLNNGEKERNQSICVPVAFDEATCSIQIPDDYQYLDYGLDLYAPQTTLDAEGRRIMTAWVRMPKVADGGWIGMFCSPRVVEVQDGPHLLPHASEYPEGLFAGHSDPAETRSGYLASFDLTDGGEINIGGYLITRKGNRIVTDRTAVYPSFEGAHLISETPDTDYNNPDGTCHLDVIVDSNLIEVYVNDGEYVISSAVYGLTREIRCSGCKESRVCTRQKDKFQIYNSCLSSPNVVR